MRRFYLFRLAAAGFGAACSDGTGSSAVLAPANVAAASSGPGMIVVQWTHPGGAFDEFRIERRVAPIQGTGPFDDIAAVPSDARVYADQGVAQGTRYEYRLRACTGGTCSDYSGSAFAVADPQPRAGDDRADDVTGAQVRVMYVLPSDATDRMLDRDGTLARSVASFHSWFGQRSGGLSFRFDTYQGVLDIGFFRLPKSDAQVQAEGSGVVREIERLLGEAGRLARNKIYLVYYDGGSTYACGGAAWPPNVPGQVAAMYLTGSPPGVSCASAGFVSSPSAFPGYWEFAALHDLVHTLGIVSPQAPHHTTAYPAHVPEANDLMYSGASAWVIDESTRIDVGGDDYFGASVQAGLPTLTTSPYVAAPGASSALRAPVTQPTPRESARLSAALARFPMHAPF